MKVCEKIAKVNKIDLPEDLYDQIVDLGETLKKKQADEKKYNVLDVFRTPRVRMNTIILFYILLDYFISFIIFLWLFHKL